MKVSECPISRSVAVVALLLFFLREKCMMLYNAVIVIVYIFILYSRFDYLHPPGHEGSSIDMTLIHHLPFTFSC